MLKRVAVLALFMGLCMPAMSAQADISPSVPSARSLMDAGHDREAVDMLQKLVHASADDYQAWFLLGVAYARQHQYHEAIEAFRKVSELRPDLAEPHNNLAVIYNELGDLRAAVHELEISLAKNPDYATAQENLGDLYVKLALQSYQRSLAQAPSDELQVRYNRLLQVRVDGPSAHVDTRSERPVVAQPVMDERADEPKSAGQVTKSEVTPTQSSETVDVAPKVVSVSPTTAIHESEADAVAGVQADMAAADPSAPVQAAIEAWRQAWSERNVPVYLAAYGSEFDPGDRFATRKEWEQYKQRVISSKRFIKVTLDDVHISLIDDSTARVLFMQHFRSNNYNSDERKELRLRQTEDGWKITHEKSL